MKYSKILYCFLSVILYLLSFNYSSAQTRNYKVDSLQIKVYTEIEYVNSQSKDIVVKKVFCDYCTDIQVKYLKEKAIEFAFYDRYNPKKKIINGKRKFAVIIRVSKKDFLALKNKSDN